MITNGAGDFVKWSVEHDHLHDVAQCDVTKFISTMKKRASEEHLTPVQQIYTTEAATLASRDLDFTLPLSERSVQSATSPIGKSAHTSRRHRV